MIVTAQVTIKGTAQAVFAAITDIGHAVEILSGVERTEILDRPAQGLVGLRWRETRLLFGKPATVEKWITEAVADRSFTTRAEDNGLVFITTHRLSARDGLITLIGIHDTRPQGLLAKLRYLPMVFFKGMIKQAILQDLNDIKRAVENSPT